MSRIVKPTQRFFRITLRPGDRILVRCRRHRDDDFEDDSKKTRKTRKTR